MSTERFASKSLEEVDRSALDDSSLNLVSPLNTSARGYNLIAQFFPFGNLFRAVIWAFSSILELSNSFINQAFIVKTLLSAFIISNCRQSSVVFSVSSLTTYVAPDYKSSYSSA